ncbi:MAG: hypothetical protein IJR82_03955 [Bacilli bacterium]|nr:hypothetical protein [Bacilli bacterium]
MDVDKKIEIIDDNNISDSSLINIIYNSPDEQKNKLLEQYLDVFNGSELERVIKSIKEESDRKNVAIKYMDKLDSSEQQSSLILSFEDISIIKTILEECDLESFTLQKVITEINIDDVKMQLTVLHLEKLGEIDLYKIINSMKDANKMLVLTKLCITKIGESGLFHVFEELYDRFCDTKDLAQSDNLSDILDEIADNYLDMFFFKGYTSDFIYI